LNNKTLPNARRVEGFYDLSCRADLNYPPTAVGGIR